MLVGDVYQTLTTDTAYAPFLAYADAITKRDSWKATFDEDFIVAHTKTRVKSMRAQTPAS